MNGIDPNVWIAVKPTGLALALLLTTSAFAVLTTVVIGLRIYIRLKTRRFGTDDWVMTAGYVVNLGQSKVVIYGSYSGIGTSDDRLNAATRIEGFKALLMWQAFYAGSLAFIKSSICITLMRITQQRMYLNILRALIILSAILSTVGLIIIVNQCHPLTRYWDKRVPGTCWPPIIATVLSYIASASNVVADLTVAVIPIFLLRQIQMRSRLKLYVRLILGLGILAGIASIIRVPFTNAYMKAGDLLYHTANIVLWTIVECGLGIIAGSLPMLRAFFKRLAGDESTRNPENSGGTNLVTIGQIKGRHGPVYENAIHVTVVADGDNDSNDNHDADNESTRHIIRVTREIRQTGSEESLGRKSAVTVTATAREENLSRDRGQSPI